MSWLTSFFMALSVVIDGALSAVTGGVLAEHYLGKSLEERVVEHGEQCAIQCDFQGATSYSINLGDERDCICTFKITRKK